MTNIHNNNPQNRPCKRIPALTAIAAVAAAFVLLIGGYALTQKNTTPEIDSVILLDVNPSLAISVDADEIVQAVDARNEEARDVLGTMDLTGTSLEVSVNALIGAMMQKGYLDDIHNSILVSVENKDTARSAQLQQKISQAITSAMHTDTMDAAVLSQNVDPDDDTLAQLAQQHNISLGKASLIQEVIAQDPTLTFESLTSLSINDIALIAASKQLNSPSVTQTGTASDKAYIGREAALEKALDHAGVSATDAFHVHVEFDSENGLMVYEVEFETATQEYDYDINARTGEVVKHESEKRDDREDHDGDHHHDSNDGSNNTSYDRNPVNESSSGQTDTSAETPSYIGKDAALSAALAHAGVTVDQLSRKDISLDEEDGRMVYEVDFQIGRTEYDYEIDALTGQVLKAEKELDD